jgi:hypothetical protein
LPCSSVIGCIRLPPILGLYESTICLSNKGDDICKERARYATASAMTALAVNTCNYTTTGQDLPLDRGKNLLSEFAVVRATLVEQCHLQCRFLQKATLQALAESDVEQGISYNAVDPNSLISSSWIISGGLDTASFRQR